MVKIGLEQTLVYSSDDDLKYGPFHLSDEKKEESRMDREVALLTEQVSKKLKTKIALVDDLMEHDWGKQLVKISSSGSLQEICVKKCCILE